LAAFITNIAESNFRYTQENLLICKAAFEKALFVYPDAHLEMRQGARIILKSKEEPPPPS
jgi:hypothetical protein